MEQAFSKNEKVSYRLADILTRLNMGEKLSIKSLAEEYQTHPRTISRDLNERLAFLPFEIEGDSYFLPSHYLGKLTYQDIKNFAQISGFANLYPKLDKSFLREILDSRANSVYSAKGYFFEDASLFSDTLSVFKAAIQARYQVEFVYKHQPRLVQPYRIIHHHGCWYLAAVSNNQLRAYRMSRISQPQPKAELGEFDFEPTILKQLENEESIWFGQQKQEVILSVHGEVALHFKQRQLLPEQEVIKSLDDGGLLVSSKITHVTQILPLVRYWIPHLKIVNPESLQQQLESELKGYLG
ncbi:YafY family protein [uncultured Agitococcus sp.]|uniref:helix-turn-helix transcriptional regulator n=1 Tax=uncultured Agitococcus sp. TaxID=1506599 RepID=UPI0026107DBB|nr:WYL domain-containing protein [uncultured Agitococcus sp.]